MSKVSTYTICPSCKSKTVIRTNGTRNGNTCVWCGFPIKSNRKRAVTKNYMISVPSGGIPSYDSMDAKLFIEPISSNIGNMGKDIIISMVNAIINRWDAFRSVVPVIRIDFETAEHVLYHSKCFPAIYEEITGIKIDISYPTDEYLKVMEISAHMMTIMLPQFRKEHIYKNTMNQDKLLEIYSHDNVKITFSIAGIIWNLIHPYDDFHINLLG